TPDGISATEEGGGKAAIRRYFERLGDLVTFWQVTRASNGDRVAVEVEESFTIHPAGLAGRSEITLLFDLQDGLITGLSVGEGGPRAGSAPPASGGMAWPMALGPAFARVRRVTPRARGSALRFALTAVRRLLRAGIPYLARNPARHREPPAELEASTLARGR